MVDQSPSTSQPKVMKTRILPASPGRGGAQSNPAVTNPVLPKTAVENANTAAINQLASIAEKLATAAQAISTARRNSEAEKTAKKRKKPAKRKIVKVPPVPPTQSHSTVIIIGPDGKIQSTRRVPSSATSPARQPAASGGFNGENGMNLRVKAEPKLMPRPGRKPAVAALLPERSRTSGQPDATDLKNLSPARNQATAGPPAYVRPARRISPELMEKLRRKLRQPKPRAQAGDTSGNGTSTADAGGKPTDEDTGVLNRMFKGLGNFFGGDEKDTQDPEEITEVTPPAKPQGPKSAQIGPIGKPGRYRSISVPIIPVRIESEETDQERRISGGGTASPHPSAGSNPFEPPVVSEASPAGKLPAKLPVASAPPRPAYPEQPAHASTPPRQGGIDVSALPRRMAKEITGRQFKPRPVQSQTPPRSNLPPEKEPSGVLASVKRVFSKAKTPAPKSKRKTSNAPATEIASLQDGTRAARRATRQLTSRQSRSTNDRRRPSGAPLARLRKPLQNVLLTLGDSIATEQPQLPRGIAEPDACVRKQLGKVFFCIIPVDWPRNIEDSFRVNTSFYQGSRAIARYDKGKATHYHAMFNSSDYDGVIEFLRRRFGPPTDVWKRVIAPFDQPRQPNPTFVWRSKNTETDTVTILEIRKFDDTREVFPDINHGAIRLYVAGGPPVFPVITALDIMNIDWTARSDHVDDASPINANSLRVRP